MIATSWLQLLHFEEGEIVQVEECGSGGGQCTVTLPLLSVPYALKAADARTLGGLPPSAFALARHRRARPAQVFSRQQPRQKAP